MKKKQKPLKVIILTLSVILGLLLSGMIYARHNLATHLIYYAKHLPRAKGTNPEMALILDHLDSLGESTIQGIRYDTDGHHAIIKENEPILTQWYDVPIQYAILPNDNEQENYRMYFFSKSGKFINYFYQKPDNNKEIYERSNARKKEAQHYVNEILHSIINKLEKKPKVNLQWLFNKKYAKRFSNE